MSESILYICAHPDDCELMFGGMIHSFVKKGMDVSVIVVAAANGLRMKPYWVRISGRYEKMRR